MSRTLPLVSVTRLRVRSRRFLPIFFIQALRSARQAARTEGNLAARILRNPRNTFWTATMWTDEALKQFVQTDVHGRIMRKLLDWCDEAAVVRWSQDGTDLPTWPELYVRLKNEGRRSKVNHPSPAHTSYQFPEPTFGPGAELRFK
jgi:hypothetical protein